MKKHIALLALFTMCLALAGCKKDAEVNAILGEFDSFTDELVRRVESVPNPSVGVDDAQKYFDSKKADISARLDSIKTMRGYQVSEDSKQKMTTTLVADASKVANLQMKYLSQSAANPAFKAKLDKLVTDYRGLFSP